MFLTWFDILGFDKLAKEIKSKTGINESKVRRDFINLLNNKVEILRNRKLIIGSNYGNRDDWILVTDSLQNTILSIDYILDHDTEYINYKKIPLEIGFSYVDDIKDEELSDLELIIKNQTIKFLKSNMIYDYRSYYKEIHQSSIK